MVQPMQTLKGMSLIRHSEQVNNSFLKRNKIKGSVMSVICGCGNCCGFSYIVKSKASENSKYQEWLNKYSRLTLDRK